MASLDNPLEYAGGGENAASSYIVIKCKSLESLQRCIATGVWAFRKRNKPPQPQDILERAHFRSKGCTTSSVEIESNSRVILVFSVNNQHGWHGYCQSLYPLKLDCDENKNQSADFGDNVVTKAGSADVSSVGDIGTKSGSIDAVSGTNLNGVDSDNEWCNFSVKWITHFQSFNSYECLPFERTRDLVLLESNNACVNTARNWQEMSQTDGRRMCELIDQHFVGLEDKKRAIASEKIEQIKAKESFFKNEESAISSCEDISAGWQSVIDKVEKDLGKVILACPFGSQSHSAQMDYTVLELQRYCELLVAGDPRYVETLFLEKTPIVAFATESWKLLCNHRHLLVTKDCLDKYLREATGTKGIKLFEKWRKEMKDGDAEKAPQKMNKLAYIILRLLQSGRDLVRGEAIKVYRMEGSKERQELLNARLGHYNVFQLQELFENYLDEIERARVNVVFTSPDVAKTQVQQWLVKIRLDNLAI